MKTSWNFEVYYDFYQKLESLSLSKSPFDFSKYVGKLK